MKKQKDNNYVGLIHIGEREKSGLQILEKLNQHSFKVEQWDVLSTDFQLSGVDEVDVLVVNIGNAEFEYDDMLSDLFEKDIKIIINEASLTNQLSGIKRQSWERHLLNKIDSSFSIIPIKEKSLLEENIDVKFDKFGVEQVWLLIASIGGPESIQNFLSEFNGDEKVYFIIIQHMDKEFLPMMAKQLNHDNKLSVDIPISGMKILPSKCILNPTDDFIKYLDKGILELEPINDEYAYTPCIDECSKRLIVNINKLNIAVFSGMSTDGVAAATQVKEKGNMVITQTESSCVLSTIIEGIKNKISVDFEGTPNEMAKFVIDKISTNKSTIVENSNG